MPPAPVPPSDRSDSENLAERLAGSRTAWAVAVALSIGGIAWWLVSESDFAWIGGVLLVMPLALLMLFRSGVDTSGGDGGAWGPP